MVCRSAVHSLVLDGPAVNESGLNSAPLTAAGNYVVTWVFNYTPAVDDWRAGVVDALTQYVSGTGEWSAVETTFVDGWATQYAKENA